MKRTFKNILVFALCFVMVFGTVAVGSDGFAEVLSVLNIKASADNSDYSVGDIIYYGLYPQTEVTDKVTIAALNDCSGTWVSYGYYSGTDNCDGQMVASDYMRYKDVSYNGSKYRAVTFDNYRPIQTGDTVSADNSLQDDNGYTVGNVYWFKFEPIKWQVLDPSTGLVMCATVIDSQAYNNYVLAENVSDPYHSYTCWGNSAKTYYTNNYAESSIREWLNDDFFNTAFSDEQKANILTTTINNSAYSTSYSAYDSASTSDKVYLLSYSEVLNSSYGFSTSYKTDDTARQLKGSDYAKAQGLNVGSGYDSTYVGYAPWYLRSAGDDSGSTCYVDAVGKIRNLNNTDLTYIGVVPALNLKNLYISEIIEYGTYPQTKVTDSATIAALNSCSGTWVSYGYYSGSGSNSDGQMVASDYMRYKDVSYNGDKYRAVTFDSYRPYYTGNTSSSTYQDDNGYTTGNVYWFKYEPIKWRVLDPSTGMVMCDTIIDSQAYNNYILWEAVSDPYYSFTRWGNSAKTYYANNYAESSIRQWLNDDFYNTAFSDEQKANILTTTIDNSAYSTSYSAYDSASTSDKVYLLSYSDVLNCIYGFSTSTDSGDTDRQLKGSDYAKAQGLYVYTGSGSTYCSHWRLRSAGSYSGITCYVNKDGYVYGSYGTDDTNLGVVPAMNLQTLKSDTAGSEIAVSNGDGTHSVYDKNAGLVATERCTYTEITDKCTVTHICSECGYSYEVTTHVPTEAIQENIVMPTETAKGSYDEVVYCSACKEELSRETKTIPVGFISASCDKTSMLRGETATWTITTTTDVAWIQLNGSYTTAAGDTKTITTYYKNTNYASDTDRVRIWTIPIKISYTVADDSIDEVWKVNYKLSGSCKWNTAMTESGDWSSELVIYRNASAMPTQTTEYGKYSLVSTDTNVTSASVGDKVTFTVKTTNDVTKVRIGHNYTIDGVNKTKAVTYQTTSSNVKSITDNGDGTSTWVISYKVPATATGETAFNVQVRGEAWGAAQSKTITVK